MRFTLHSFFALLLVIGAVNAFVEEPGQPLRAGVMCLLVVVLGGLYFVGTFYENRRSSQAVAGAEAGAGASLRVFALVWLGSITLLWVLLMVFSRSFAWTVFPIFLLYLHLLPLGAGVLAVLVLAAFAVFYPVLAHTAVLSAGGVIGPVVGALVSIFIYLAYRGLYRDAQYNAALAQRLRATQAELAQTQHEAGRLEERERLAREIHDTLAQGFSSIILMSRSAQALLGQGRLAEAGEALGVIESSAQDNLAEARRFIRDLSSPSLESSLAVSLRRLVADTEQRATAQGARLTCVFSVEGEEAVQKIPERVSQELLRVAQGALANVLAHAQATKAVVSLGVWEESLTLDIFDDGVGFSAELPRVSEDGSRYGLISLRSRVEALGGRLSLGAASPRGTILTVEVPFVSAG